MTMNCMLYRITITFGKRLRLSKPRKRVCSKERSQMQKYKCAEDFPIIDFIIFLKNCIKISSQLQEFNILSSQVSRIFSSV
ncbi:Uncharacterized protein APZ42_006256 [Daphnia magna]|uniref:Uncharacterized protein n=1 Tax=Daphnia magna TaxID=35525 RepID=A0A164G089_9CRUS|nr:Uncharacterized protein APZ42_006256 [Daphnia magna]